MKRKNFSRYYPFVLLLFVVEFALVWGAHVNKVRATTQYYTDDCENVPDDGKGR
jgi:hypothetical protein